MDEVRAVKWVTRARVKVDRVACPWLIRKFVDQDAEFLFVPREEVLAAAEREGAIPFDTPGAELNHVGDLCTFDAILEKYGLTDPALHRLAAIVRGADTRNKDLTPWSRGLDAIAEGFQSMGLPDDEVLKLEWPVYDALYNFCRNEIEREKAR
jgi:hypothetical protein